MQLRDLPSVEALASRLADEILPRALPDAILVVLAREAIDHARAELTAGVGEVDPAALARPGAQLLAGARPNRVINATGVLLHTNLGRAPMSRDAVEVGAAIAGGYGNVEFDLATGRRGGRGRYVAELLRAVTGAESGLAVNNCAGALLLALAAIAGAGRPVAVSRGELIEIGGSFRLPDLMRASGAALVEVGTTNRTRIGDYAAVVADVAAVLKVHPSNYRIEGFAETVPYADLAALAHDHDVPMIADVGSGLLDTRTPWLPGPPPAWLGEEPGVRQTLESGADLVLFSGDKLLGGPQAGITVGRADLVAKMTAHPIARAVRTDGATHAQLAATLEAYAGGTAGELPFWRMASRDAASLRVRHDAVLAAAGCSGQVVESESLPGAGSVPGETIPSPAIRIPGHAESTWHRLVGGDPPIVARRRGDALFLDLRTVDPDDDPTVVASLSGLA